MQRTLLWKIALIGAITLLLQVPVEMVRDLVLERKQARDGVVADIASRSSEAQRIAGPVLYVPWTRRSTEAVSTTDDSGRSRTTRRVDWYAVGANPPMREQPPVQKPA